MKQQDQPIVTFDRVTKKYRRLRAVDEVMFSFAPGEVVGIVGDEESGKTTLVSLLMGFSRPTKGVVMVGGRKLTLPLAHRSHRDTGFATYDAALPRSVTGERYLRAIATERHASKEQYTQLVRTFRLDLTTRIGSLSAVNQQKIALAAAFLGSPKLIVLDEPVRGLDVLSCEVLLEMVRTASLQGTAVLISSQYPSEIAQACSRMLLFRDGKIAYDLSQEEITKHTGKNVTIYTDEAIELPPHATKLRTGSQRKVKFSYTGKVQTLLEWIQGLEGVVIDDIEIESRSLDDEFQHLYARPESDENDD